MSIIPTVACRETTHKVKPPKRTVVPKAKDFSPAKIFPLQEKFKAQESNLINSKAYKCTFSDNTFDSFFFALEKKDSRSARRQWLCSPYIILAYFISKHHTRAHPWQGCQNFNRADRGQQIALSIQIPHHEGKTHTLTRNASWTCKPHRTTSVLCRCWSLIKLDIHLSTTNVLRARTWVHEVQLLLRSPSGLVECWSRGHDEMAHGRKGSQRH